jgi:hypothetical protein
MAHGTPKVYVIKPSKGENRGVPAGRSTSGSPSQSQASRTTPSSSRPGKRWRDILLAYLFGPLTVPLWSRGRSRIVWLVVGYGSVAVGALMVLLGESLTGWLGGISNGPVIWLTTVSVVTLLIAVTWVRAILAVTSGGPTIGSRFPAWMRRPGPVAALGMLVPGLGLQTGGYTRRGAWAFGIVGPVAAAAIVLAHWRWLWECSRSAMKPGISGHSLEILLMAAAGVASAGVLVWIVQALDGARRVSTSRTRSRANVASVALLLSLAFFAFTFRPVSFAVGLGATAASLRHEGLKLIPLGLCEVAMRLDPASPAHIAQAAEINEELGMSDAARAKRRVIEQRARAYNEFVVGTVGHGGTAAPSDADRPLDVEDHVTLGTAGVWRHFQAQRD